MNKFNTPKKGVNENNKQDFINYFIFEKPEIEQEIEPTNNNEIAKNGPAEIIDNIPVIEAIDSLKEEEVVEGLDGETESNYLTNPIIVDEIEPFVSRPTLRRGSRGASVTALQNYLRQLGYFNTTPNGQFGPITEQSVRNFQRSNGLSVDGIVGSGTWARIESAIQGQPSTSRPTLRRGSSGSNVLALQQGLQRLGYFNTTPNSQFGPITEQAVRDFQRASGLTVDGVVGAGTWARFDQALGALPPSHTGSRPVLRQGSTGLNVIELQLILQALGYFTGTPDGNFGPATHSAVVNFQRANGLTADGVVGPSTWQKLDSTLSASGPQVSANRTTIRQGSRGSDVMTLQQILNVLGYLSVPADGNFGPLTHAAVLAFQRAKGLTADGIVGRNTWNALYQEIAITPSEELPTIREGATGSYVTILQEKLKLLGYFAGTVDGSFGPVTTAAVRQFQITNRLVSDGVVGSSTWAALFSATALPPPPPIAPGGERPVLRLGATGPDVSFLQDELRTLMYYNGPISGTFDYATQVAVKSFQDVNRLTPDGVVGRSTWYALINLYPPKVSC